MSEEITITEKPAPTELHTPPPIIPHVLAEPAPVPTPLLPEPEPYDAKFDQRQNGGALPPVLGDELPPGEALDPVNKLPEPALDPKPTWDECEQSIHMLFEEHFGDDLVGAIKAAEKITSDLRKQKVPATGAF